MAQALKDLFAPEFFTHFLEHWQKLQASINSQDFLKAVYQENWENFELKQRLAHITQCMHKQLPEDYADAIEILKSLSQKLSLEGKERIEYYFIPTYIEYYGLPHFEESLKAIEEITKYYSCEFAVRPFLTQNPQKTMRQMQAWSFHPHPKVRRLASEGCRPHLPWAKHLNLPTNLTLPILEELKSDPSLFVRKSVANHLNDLSKTQTALFKQLLKQWKGLDKNCDWVLKHASRTLIKAGDKEVLAAFGFKAVEQISIQEFQLKFNSIEQGEELPFSFQINNQAPQKQHLRIEYALFYKKANGKHNSKVFKISERVIQPKETITIHKKHSFRKLSSRKYYEGLHFIQLILNGHPLNKLNFTLKI